MKRQRRRALWPGLTLLWVGWLLYMTLTPDTTPNTNSWVPFLDHAQALHCLWTRCPESAAQLRYLVVDFAGNILVFVPLGLGLSKLLYHPSRPPRVSLSGAILGGALLSLVIEAVQFNMPTRAADVTDLLLNSLGTALGALALLFGPRRP